MTRKLLMPTLLTILICLSLLSVLSNILAGYPVTPKDRNPQPYEPDQEDSPSNVMFTVSPTSPKLFWSIFTADYYSGFEWTRTTEGVRVGESPQPQFEDTNASKVFMVQMETSQQEILVPTPSPDSGLSNFVSAPLENLKFSADTTGDVYTAIRVGRGGTILLTYTARWREVKIDDRLISIGNLTENIRDKYLQLPEISEEVWQTARELEDPSYTVLDQILADAQFLRTQFIYDETRGQYYYSYEMGTEASNVEVYLSTRKGICIDAATALAVILRMQGIPSRVSFGFKPGNVVGGRLYYYNIGAHALTEVYLPPYGWVQFDANPQNKESPLVEIRQLKKEARPGATLLYELSVTNRGELPATFRLTSQGTQNWTVEVAPKQLRIEPLETAYALLKVTIFNGSGNAQKDLITITTTSRLDPKLTSSIWAIAGARNISRTSTTTTITDIDKAVIRGHKLWVNGTIVAANNERVDGMAVFIYLTSSIEAEGVIVASGVSKQGSFQIQGEVPAFLEIGDYRAIATSIGTDHCEPSSDDSSIRMRAATRLSFGTEDEFLVGHGAIHGGIQWDNGTALANAVITLYMASRIDPSEAKQWQNTTSENGMFRIETTFEKIGEYEVTAAFSGDEYVLGSQSSRVVLLRRGVPTLQVLGSNTATRGQFFNVTGTLLFEGKAIWGESVIASFDDKIFATIETRDNGSYAGSILIDPAEQLGRHTVTVTLTKDKNTSVTREVVVKSKTALTTKASALTSGMFVLFSASLSDDHGVPLKGARVAIDGYGVSMETNENGTSTVLLDTVKFSPESVLLTARFEGSDLYLPTTSQVPVVLEPVVVLPFLIPLVSPILIVTALAYDRYQEKRRRTAQLEAELEVQEQVVPIVKETTIAVPETEHIRIVFPDIDNRFPKVWGVEEKLNLEITVDEDLPESTERSEVSIDGETVGSVRLSSKVGAKFSHTFIRKGEHCIRVVLPRRSEPQPWKAEVTVRVVDYGEEVIRLYNEFLSKLADLGVPAKTEKTAREIESYILRASDLDPQALDKVTLCFEKAEYSNHLATRRDYEMMYLSLKELNIDVD